MLGASLPSVRWFSFPRVPATAGMPHKPNLIPFLFFPIKTGAPIFCRAEAQKAGTATSGSHLFCSDLYFFLRGLNEEPPVQTTMRTRHARFDK